MDKQFELSLLQFGRQFAKIISEGSTYIIEIKPDILKDKANTRVMSINIAGKINGYHVSLKEIDILKHKKAMGFEGSWESYFILLKQAVLEAKNGKLALNKDVLTIQYPLSESSHIKGTYTLLLSDTDVFDLLLSIYAEYYALKELSIEWKKEAEPKKEAPKEEAKKRKLNSNLVNPFKKHKNPEGAKIE